MKIYAVTDVITIDAVRLLCLRRSTYPNDELELVRLSANGVEHPAADPAIAFYEHGNRLLLWRDGIWRTTTFDYRVLISQIQSQSIRAGWSIQGNLATRHPYEMIQCCASGMHPSLGLGGSGLYCALYKVNGFGYGVTGVK